MPLRAEPATAVVSSQEMQAERNKQIVTAAFDHWTAGGSDFFNEMLTPDTVWTVEGRDRARARTGAVTTSWRVSKRVWADGDHVIINWEGEAVARDGRPYRNRYVWIFRMAEGKAVEVNAFLDLAPYDDVLRRIPAPDGEGAQ